MYSEILNGSDSDGGGFINVAISIGEAIYKSMNNVEAEMKWNGKWEEEGQPFSVSGSTAFDIYIYICGRDFGWRKMEKFEALAIDIKRSMYIGRLGKFAGDLEFGLTLEEKRMDAFIAIFKTHLMIFPR